MRIATHTAGRWPDLDPDDFDVLLSADPDPPPPWVGLGDKFQDMADAVARACREQPVASQVVAQLLRTTLRLDFEAALETESMAYSMLLASEAFRSWRAGTPVRATADPDAPRVLMREEQGAIVIHLNRPAKRNAFDAAMRDALCAALEFALQDPDQRPVILSGDGPAFSAGGDLDEFGAAKDPAAAHLIRLQQSPVRLAHQLDARLTVRLHGACVGAGIELAAAAARVVAREGAFFRLPELSMGLIPGAGGTATITRRIGRHRAAYMALSGADIDLATALRWGLIDAVA